MQVDPGKPRFPYQQVREWLRGRIASGEISTRLPTTVQLADDAGVSDGTVKRALRELKAEGLIYGVAGLGVFVTGSGPDA